MAFGGQMHHRIGAVGGKDAVQRRTVADIGLLKRIAVGLRRIGHVCQIGGIGQCVEVHDLVPARDGQPDHGRADETRAAGNQDLHAGSSKLKGDVQSPNAGAARSLSDSKGSLTPQSIPRLSQATAPSDALS
ncbi:hypothetical protein PANO111632_22115 [Paracoccus nototheniae]